MLHPLTRGAADKNKALFFVNGIDCCCCAKNEPTPIVWLKRQHVVLGSYLEHHIISIQKKKTNHLFLRDVVVYIWFVTEEQHPLFVLSLNRTPYQSDQKFI